MNPLNNRWIVVGLCGYEAFAIITGKVPTLTALQRRHRWLGVGLTLAMAHHFATSEERHEDLQ